MKFYLHFPEISGLNKIPTKDQFQHSLRDYSQCFKFDELKKVLASFPIKTFTLRKMKNDQSNYKKLTKPVNTCAVRRETKKLVNVSIENQ